METPPQMLSVTLRSLHPTLHARHQTAVMKGSKFRTEIPPPSLLPPSPAAAPPPLQLLQDTHSPQRQYYSLLRLQTQAPILVKLIYISMFLWCNFRVI